MRRFDPLTPFKLTRLALLLGVLTIPVGIGVAWLAYRASVGVISEILLQENLEIARSLAHGSRGTDATSPSRPYARVEELWAQIGSKRAGTYMCIVDHEGVMRVNTGNGAIVGKDVGSSSIPGVEENQPQTLLELLREGQDWVGYYVSPTGEPQLAAFAFSPDLNSIIAVHTPRQNIESIIHRAGLPWSIGIGFVLLFLGPLSLFLLHRGYVISQMRAIKFGRELAQSEGRMRRLVDLMPNGLEEIDREGRIVYCNRAYAEMHGYEPDELVGQPSWKVIDIASHRQLIRNFYRKLPDISGQPNPILTRTHSRTGERIEVQIDWAFDETAGPGEPAVTAVVTNISEMKNSERQARQYRKRLQSILDNTTSLVYIKDMEGRYQLINRACERLIALGSEDVIGKTDFDLFPAERAEEFQKNDREVIKSRRSLEFEEIVSVQGHDHYYYAIKFPLFDASGAIYGVCGTSTDMTERRQLQEQLRQSQKVEAVGRLAGGIAHDFNNLLTAIIGYTDMALSELDPESPVSADLGEVRRAGERASSLTNQLLAFSRRQIVQPKVHDLNVIVAAMDKLLRRLIGEDIELLTVFDERLCTVNVDSSQIEQVIMNLAVNAKDAMQGGGKLIIGTERLRLSAESARGFNLPRGGDYAILSVSDTGTGIDENIMNQIFDPFFTTKDPGRGTGLGLSTTYGIVQQSGGGVVVESRKNEGTTFRIFLPLDESESPAPPSIDSLETLGGRGELILIVEDESMVRTLATRMIEQNGYQVLSVESGAEVLSLPASVRGDVDLLITDIVLPGMNGRELALHLVKERPELKVIYMSGYTDGALDTEGVMDDDINFIQKPFTATRLLRKIRDVLDASAVRS